jgi:flagellar basal-body rod protein FlgC
VTKDKTEYPLRYDPGHPAADEKGMVRLPNVNRVVESVDMITTKNSQSALLKIYNEATSMRRLQIESGMK